MRTLLGLLFKSISLIVFALLPSQLALGGFGTDGRVFVVNTTEDTNDTKPGDKKCRDLAGKCSLRAAVEEANSNPSSRDTVIFKLPLKAEVRIEQGPIELKSNIQVAGPGQRRLTIRRASDAALDYRVFEIEANSESVTLRGFAVADGIAPKNESGGGILLGSNSRVDIYDLVLFNNQASSGGAIANHGDLVASRLLLRNNVAENGGGIANIGDSARLSLGFSTLFQNSGVSGGGIENSGKLFLINNTLWQNSADSEASEIFNAKTGTTTTINTIFGGDPFSKKTALSGSFNSAGTNIIVDPRNSSGFINGVNGDQVSVGRTVIDPKLSGLNNNGGDSDTLAPLEGSPAISNGTACGWQESCHIDGLRRHNTDQRRRFVIPYEKGVDIGALDSRASKPTGPRSFGLVITGIRRAGVIWSLTNLSTSTSRSRIVHHFGAAFFYDLEKTDVYLREVKMKSGPQIDPSLIDFYNGGRERFLQ